MNEENNFGEAPCVVWMYVYSEVDGKRAKANITIRDTDEKRAFDRLMDLEAYTDKNYGFTMWEAKHTSYASTTKSDAKSNYNVNQTEQTGQQNVKYEVTALMPNQTSKGTPNLKVKGGNWQKYGQTAWVEVVPEVMADFTDEEKYPLGQDITDIPPEMTFAIYDPNNKKVIGFSEA